MDKKKRKVYTPAEKRRRNRRHNAIVTSIAVVLMLAGIIIIVSDTTFFFDDAGRWIRRNIFGEVFETIPPFPTGSPSKPSDPDDPNNPNIGPQGSLVPRPTFSPDETPLPENVTEEPFIYDYAPECVYFPQYDITCPVDPVGYNWRGEMATVRSPFRAGWLKYSGDPVTGGNVILAGHNRYSGKLGYFSVVKDKLQPWDQVIVKMQNGEYAYYIVESINQYHYQHVPWEVMQHDGESRLTLITCLGDFSSSAGTSMHRVVAVCRPYTGE